MKVRQFISQVAILVLFTALFDVYGGIPSFNRALAKALDQFAAEQNQKLTLLSLNDSAESPMAERYLSSKQTLYHGFSGNRLKFALRALFESRKSRVIFFGHVNLSPLSLGMKNCEKFLVIHGLEVSQKLPWLQGRALSNFKQILAVSNFTREVICKKNRITTEKISIFPDTLDPFYGISTSSLSREALGLPEGNMILTVSRLEASEPYKGIALIIQSLPAILKEKPDTFFVLVGDGSDRARLKSLVKELRLESRVIFAGKVGGQELFSYFNACDLFALPSTMEGFGIVFLEAMYHAKPCIGASAGGIPEVIEDGKTGLLINPANPQALPEAVLRLLNDKTLCREMGQAGKKRLEEKFSFEAFCNNLRTLLC